MLVMPYPGNLFLLPDGEREAAVVTTNGIVKSNRDLVMGAGIAKYCRDNYDGIAAMLGDHVSRNGNVPAYAGRWRDPYRETMGKDPMVTVLSCPTKGHFRDHSDLRLIRESCRGLVRIADEHGLVRVYVPALGCALGRLSWKDQVRPAIAPILDDRFTAAIDPAYL